MSADPDRQPPFYCPACGQRHRADLSGIRDHAGATARVTCARCAAVMALRIDERGLPTCEVLEAAPAEAAQAAGAAAPEGTSSTSPGGVMDKRSSLLTLVAATIVAAVVGFAAARLGAPASSPAAPADLEPLRQRLARLEAQVAPGAPAASPGAAAAQRLDALETGQRSLESGLGADNARLVALEGALGGQREAIDALQEALGGLREDRKETDGRIEANYATIRALTKRVEAVEGR